jgi:hypothetical protein
MKKIPLKSVTDLLGNWNVLNENLLTLNEAEVKTLLAWEKEHANRITFIMRLHSRMNKLRRERERRVYAKKILK